MKKTIYICDVCKKEANSEIPKNDNEEIKGKLKFKEKNVNILIKVKIEDVEHVCKTCKIKVMESFLKKEIVDKHLV